VFSARLHAPFGDSQTLQRSATSLVGVDRERE
jgi:hypothetical protein